MPLLKCQNLSKSFRHPTHTTLFAKICLEVEPEESLAIVGPSGSGKTTLLHILGTLEDPTSGELWIDQQLVTRHNRSNLRKTTLGFVFQNYHLLEQYSVLDNVLMPSRIHRHTNIAHAQELLEQVQLSHRMSHEAKLLSGGEKQRVAIARALANHPKILLADEPTGNLDPVNSERIGHLLLSLAKQQGRSLIMVTHDQRLAKQCDRLYTIST